MKAKRKNTFYSLSPTFRGCEHHHPFGKAPHKDNASIGYAVPL